MCLYVCVESKITDLLKLNKTENISSTQHETHWYKFSPYEKEAI